MLPGSGFRHESNYDISYFYDLKEIVRIKQGERLIPDSRPNQCEAQIQVPDPAKKCFDSEPGPRRKVLIFS